MGNSLREWDGVSTVSPQGQIDAAGAIGRSSMLHRQGWRRRVFFGLLFGVPGALIALSLVMAIAG